MSHRRREGRSVIVQTLGKEKKFVKIVEEIMLKNTKTKKKELEIFKFG